MSFEYDDVGNFGSRSAAEEWAKRNNIDPRDLHIREDARGCDVGVRRSAIPSGGFDDSDKRRKDGFFWKDPNVKIHLLLAAISAALVAQPAYPQKLGKGGTGVDETSELPRCSKPLGSVALVEEKTAPSVEDQLPPGMRALVQMAERQQNGGSPSKVDPLAQSFEKEEGRAGATVEQMHSAATKLKKFTQGASIDEMRAQFNKPAAKDCQEHAGDCPDCPKKDCTPCEEHEIAAADCTDCAEHAPGQCKEKGHS